MKKYRFLHDLSRLEIVLISWAITFSIALVCFGTANLPIKDVDNFLTSGLQAIAAIVSIVFILSILAIEQSAKNFSATMLELFKKDLFVWFTAIYGLITIGFFAGSILFELNSALLCFVLFIWNLALLGIYLHYILNLINPTHAIGKLVASINNAFNKASKKINEEASNKIKNNPIYHETDPSIIKHMVIGGDKKILDEVKKYETYMQYVILSAYKKQEYVTTEKALNSYSQIIKRYIQLNSDHFWPDDSFFELIRERIREYISRALQDDDDEFLKQNLKASLLVVEELLAIKNMNSSMAYNEPLGHLTYTLSNMCKEYFEQKMSEEKFPRKRWNTILQFTRTLGKIGTRSVIRSGKDSQSGTQILEIGKFAIRKGDTFSSITCVREAFRIFQERARFPSDYMLGSEMKELAKYASLAYRLPNAVLFEHGFFFEQSGLGPLQYAVNAIHSHNTPFRPVGGEDIERRNRIESLKKHISLIIDFTGKISHVNSNDTILKIITLYLRETKKLFCEPFTHDEEIKVAIDSLSSEKRTENLAELAIICLVNEYSDSAISCIEAISLSARNMMKNDEDGSDSNRALWKLNLIGCYLQSYPDDLILNMVIKAIVEFNEQFEKQYKRPATNLPSPDSPHLGYSEEFNYRNLDPNFKNQILHIDNRQGFEKIIKDKIKDQYSEEE